MNTKIIKLDLNKPRLYEKIKAKQGDTESRFLLFQLFDGALPFSLVNRSVRAYMIKPDSKEVFNDLIINDRIKGYCTLELTNQVLASSGTVKIELMITEGTKKLTSSVFELEVDKSINSEKSIVSTNEFTALLNGLASLSEYDNYKNELNDARDGEVNVGTNIRKVKSQLETITNYVSKFNNFIDACNYCTEHNQNLTLDSDITVNLNTNLTIPNIFGNGKMININGSGKLTTNKNIKIDNLTLVNTTGDMAWFCLEVENNFTSLNNVTFKNFINPCILNSQKVVINQVNFYNCGQGVYLRNTTDSEINNILFMNTTTERENIINNHASSLTGIDGYDGVLLEYCNNVIINNPIFQGCPERALYSSSSNNVTINNPICKYTGGLKFVGYNNIVTENFVVNNATINEVNGDALFQLYRCKNVYLNGVTSFSSGTNSCGWIIRAGQTVENVKLTNCNATRITRSVFDFNADFPTRASESYCRKIDLNNIKAYDVGLIKWLPYPILNLDKKDVMGGYIFSDITLKDSRIYAYGFDGNADYGSPTGYGMRSIVKGDMIERLTIENNEIKGVYDCNTDGSEKSYPQLFFDLGENVNQIKIRHKFKSKYFSINKIIPSSLKVTHDSLIEILCNSGIDTTNVKIKPYATNSDTNITLLNSFILEFASNNFSNKGTAWLELTDISKTKNGKITCIADNKMCDFLIKNTDIIMKTSDDIFGNTWVNDGKIRLYNSNGQLILRCGSTKDIITNGIIMCKV